MNILDIIEKKKNGNYLSQEEIIFAFNGYLNNEIKDYQISSLLMAITINGMTDEETFYLTDVMLHSGKTIRSSFIEGIQVDKHSTGGVGDKTSLVLGPILAALGLKMGKLSGRGLGYTGGTIDKLESIPGFRVSLTTEEFIEATNNIGFAECEQTVEFTPLDKMIYSLRSATGTVESIPLIASSIMSKKLAIGAKYILIDIKVGEGALLKTKEEALKLAKLMIEIGKHYDKEVIPVLTDMSSPLGDNIGNALEVIEAIEVLNGKSGEVRDLCIYLASLLYVKAMNTSIEESEIKVKQVIDDKSAYFKFLEFVKNQGGDISNLPKSQIKMPIVSKKTGKIEHIDALKIGKLALKLGSGRIKKDDTIDPSVGIILNKRIGDKVQEGETLCYLYQKDTTDYSKEANDSFTII